MMCEQKEWQTIERNIQQINRVKTHCFTFSICVLKLLYTTYAYTLASQKLHCNRSEQHQKIFRINNMAMTFCWLLDYWIHSVDFVYTCGDNGYWILFVFLLNFGVEMSIPYRGLLVYVFNLGNRFDFISLSNKNKLKSNFLPTIKLVLKTFVLCLIPEGITHLIKHRRLQSNCIIHLIVFSIHLQSFSIQFLIVSVVTVSYYATPCLVISIYTPPQKFSI